MREETITPNRLIAFTEGVFAMIVTVMVLELEAADSSALLLFIVLIWLKHHDAVRWSLDARIDVGQLCPSLWPSFLPFAIAGATSVLSGSAEMKYHEGLSSARRGKDLCLLCVGRARGVASLEA
jgi:TMEM175 potassium channel family protein